MTKITSPTDDFVVLLCGHLNASQEKEEMRAFILIKIGFACLMTTLLLYVARPVSAQGTKQLVIRPVSGPYTGKQFYTNSHAVIIGINEYAHLPKDNWLQYAAADAVALRKVLIESYGFLPENVTLLLNEQATKANIEAALSALDNDDRVKPDDRVLVYYSGHGQTVGVPGGGDMGFLIPYDAKVDLDKPGNRGAYYESCLPMDALWRSLELSSAKHRLLIADACYGGLLASERALGGERPSAAVIGNLLTRPAMQVLTAGRKNETARENPNWGHGALTYKLLEELRANAAEPGTVLLASELAAKLKVSVGNITEGKQSPQFGNHSGTEGDFIFVSLSSRPVPTPEPLPSPKPLPDPKPEPVPSDKKIKHHDKDGAEMIYIPEGEFTMGTPQEEVDALNIKYANTYHDDFAPEAPQHKVRLSGYYIYKDLVTVGQYKLFCDETGRNMPPAPAFNPNWSKKDHPIVNVSWNDAKAYCEWAGVSLPTEAQWEKAARGTDGRKFPWGNAFDTSKLWCSRIKPFDAEGTTSVGHYTDSPYGVSDMAGNVFQWCEDFYGGTGGFRNAYVLRGGSWDNIAEYIFRCANRARAWANFSNGKIGFRCVMRPD